MNIVLIETSGNQRYIFATNKLRENVGASELTYQIGTKCVLAAAGRPYDYEKDKNGNKLRQLLLNEQLIETNSDENAVEIIIATSGKALLLTKTEPKAKEIVRKVTTEALRLMPGLTVHGAICKVEDDLTDVHKAVGTVHRRLEEIRHRIPSTQQRFQRLPFVAPCATSGLPASEIYKHKSLPKTEEANPHSLLSITKQEEANDGRRRLEETIRLVNSKVKLMANINDLEKKFKETKWLAIIHADGNGLGEIFLNFNRYLGLEISSDNKIFKNKDDARKYIEAYRKFSIALDVCTLNATGFALEYFQKSWREDNSKEKTGIDTIALPFIPLILGGDDLTVICDGKYAIKFTTDFLEQFERETIKLDEAKHFGEVAKKLRIEINSIQKEIIPFIAQNAFGVERLGICAGIAIVKPHYPFHSAYRIAESLLRSAKQVKIKVTHEHKGRQIPIPCSALDYHVHYDTSGSDLDLVREKLEVDGGETLLYKKPYVVTEGINNEWIRPRTFEKLQATIEAMQDDNEETQIPNSQLHKIRESLFYGRAEADAEVNLAAHRYKGFKKLLEHEKANDGRSKNSLFTNDGGKNITGFLDALDLVEFWHKKENRQAAANGDEQ